MCVFAWTSLLGVNWTGSTMLGLGPGPSPLQSGSRRSLSVSSIKVNVIRLIKQLHVHLVFAR